MNELSIDNISNKLGIANYLNEQSLNLLTSIGVNLLGGVLTLVIGFWLSRKAAVMTRDWLSKLTGSIRHWCRYLVRLCAMQA